MNTSVKRTLASLLAMLMAAGCTACGGSETVGDTTEGTTEAVETGIRDGIKDSLPSLDFEGKKARIAASNDKDIINMQTDGAESGDIVSESVFRRNLAVEERLNIDIEHIYPANNGSDLMAHYRTVILAGEDAYDIVLSTQWLALQNSADGLFSNLANAPYIDYSQPWWNDEYMKEIQVNDDTRYVLLGDISVFTLRNLSAMFYNKHIYEDLYGDPNDLYATVLDGSWTHDKFQKMVAEAYKDVNGNTEVDTEDILGCGGNTSTQADLYSYTAGLVMTEHDADGYPMLTTKHDKNVKIIETLQELYYNNTGFMIFPGSEQTGKQMSQFTDGRMLFLGERLYATEWMREMDDEYGIIPFPKLDESQKDYLTLVHDSTTVHCVPITVSSIDFPCAVLEALCAETYRTVTPAYYEIALKVKYARDDTSSQIIDMIHSNITTDFIYANNYALSNMGVIARVVLWNNNKEYMSSFDSMKAVTEEGLTNLIKQAKANIK